MEKNNRIGYSSKIDDPAFTQYLKNSNRWSAWFSLGLALIAIVGFFIHGEMSDNMENPESLYIGLVIGSMFMLIAFYQIHSRKRDKTMSLLKKPIFWIGIAAVGAIAWVAPDEIARLACTPFLAAVVAAAEALLGAE